MNFLHYATANIVLVVTITISMLVFAYAVEKVYLVRQRRRNKQELQRELVPVMGEGEKMFKTVEHFLELPFTYTRMALYTAVFLLPFMLFLNVIGLQGYNILFSLIIILLLIKIAVRWPVVLSVMGLGVFENFLSSTPEKPEDLSVGAKEGLVFFVKLLLAVMLFVWLASVVLTVIPFSDAPKSFFMVTLGIVGGYTYMYLNKIPTWPKVRHCMMLIPFGLLIWSGVTNWFGISSLEPFNWLASLAWNAVGGTTTGLKVFLVSLIPLAKASGTVLILTVLGTVLHRLGTKKYAQWCFIAAAIFATVTTLFWIKPYPVAKLIDISSQGIDGYGGPITLIVICLIVAFLAFTGAEHMKKSDTEKEHH